jgi:hypothetical protein
MRFIGEFCADQGVAPIPPNVMTRAASLAERPTESQGQSNRVIFSGGWETNRPKRAGSRRNLLNW